MFKQSVKDSYGKLLFIIGFIIIGFFKVSPIFVVVFSAIAGILKFRNTEIEEPK